MSWEPETLEMALEQAVQSLAERRGTTLATAVAPIIMTNLTKGRVQHYLGKQSDRHPIDYVWRVADYYEQWHEYVYAVQAQKRVDIWEPLYEKLQKWAYAYLPRIGYPADASQNDRIRHAQECAAEAAIVLINACFPYDVNFQPWACVLLQNVTHKHAARNINPILKAQASAVKLDAWDDWLHNLPDPASEEDRHRIELRRDLLETTDQLSSEARRQFILLYYFEGHSFAQIADEMGKRVNALYKLHFDALAELRKIWSADRDKYE